MLGAVAHRGYVNLVCNRPVKEKFYKVNPLSDSSSTQLHNDNVVTASPTRVRWLIFVLAGGTSWFLYLHRFAWNIIRPELMNQYELTNTEVDTVFSLFNVSYALGQIPGGMICDYFGAHLFLPVIILSWTLILPLFGMTDKLMALFGTSNHLATVGGLRLCFGATQAGCYPALTKVTRQWFPQRTRTTIQGFVASFFGRCGGAMSSIIMVTVLMGWLAMTWQTALLVMSGAGIVFAVLFLIFYRNTPDQDPRVNDAEVALIRDGEESTSLGSRVLPFRRVIKNRSMSVFIFQQLMNAGADNIFVYLMGSYFLTFGIEDPLTRGIVISLPLWGGALGGITGGALNDGLMFVTGNRRWSRSAVGFLGKFLACIFMLITLMQEDGITAGCCLFVVKFFTDWTQPTVWGTCTDMGGRYSATTFSIINTAGSAAGIITPLVFGMILDHYTTIDIVSNKSVTNFSPILVIVAAMYLVAAICWVFIDCTHSLEHDHNND